jgi:hypothetical protein
MATVPGVLTLARSPMSDLLGGAIVLTGYYCFWKFVRSRPGDISWAVAGTMVLAIGVWVRIPNLMYLGIIGFAGFFGQAVPLRQRVRTLVLLGLAFAVAIVPLLVFNYLSFDHPMRTGYDFWMPRQDGGSSAAPVVAFSSYRLTAQRHFIWHEIIQHENWMNIAYLFGTGSYLNPTLVLIAIVGAATALMSRDRAAVVIGCAAMLTFIPVLMLRTSDPRNWIAFPMMLPFVAGRQMSLLFRQAARPPRRDWVSIVAIVLLSAAAVAGWPGRNATFETKELIDVARFRGRSELNLAVRHLDRLTTGQRTLVITNFNTSYVYALTDGDRIVSPFRAIDMPTFSERWFPPQARRAQLREALSSGRTVYGLLMSGPPERYLPPPAGYEWEPVWRGRRSIVLARLVKL